MDRNRIARWLLIAAVAMWIGRPIPLEAQFGPLSSRTQTPQAKSQQELDQYLKIITDDAPQRVLTDVNAFANQFPNSELLGSAYQYEMDAYEQIGNFPAMLASGQRALKAQPDNLHTLLTLAPALANLMFQDPSDTQLPILAEEYAHRALDGIEKIKLPRQMPLEQWLVQKKEMQSSAHQVLGLVALKRRQPSAAISELQLAIQFATAPDGAQYLRLGLAFAAAGDRRNAEESFRRAAQLGPDSVRQLAAAEIGNLPK